jgi:hypothetical protein
MARLAETSRLTTVAAGERPSGIPTLSSTRLVRLHAALLAAIHRTQRELTDRHERRARVWATEVGILRERAVAVHGPDSWEARQWDRLPLDGPANPTEPAETA